MNVTGITNDNCEKYHQSCEGNYFEKQNNITQEQEKPMLQRLCNIIVVTTITTILNQKQMNHKIMMTFNDIIWIKSNQNAIKTQKMLNGAEKQKKS